MTDLVLLERQGHLAIVTLNRPERMNALSRDLLLQLGEVGRRLSQEPDVRAVVLTGSGERAFCAGADLKERREMSDDDIRRQLHLYESELSWLSAPHFPTIAAINGVALGGGLELALCCDLRVAVASAELGLPEVSLGIIPAAGGTQRLVRLVGEARAKEMILRSERLSAKQALAIGLVHRVVKNPAKLVSKTLEYIQPILDGAPIAERAALRAIAGAQDLPLSAGLALERQCYELCLTSQDRKEALAAFAEKRRPTYRGK